MINEKVDAEMYLQGENLYRDIEYRICILLSKLFYSRGLKSILEIREALKYWAKEKNFYLTVSMNSVAERVIKEDMQLQGQKPVRVNKSDIATIKDKFDTYEERLVALAVLCYAKVYADDDGQFTLSLSALSHWLTFQPKYLRKYLNRLIDLGYIELVSKGDVSSWYKTTVVVAMDTYVIKVPYKNTGNISMSDNNIEQLYEDAFLNNTWYTIPGCRGWYRINDDQEVKVCERVINGRHYYGKVLHPTCSSSGRLYVNLLNENGKQIKRSIDDLYSEAKRLSSRIGGI